MAVFVAVNLSFSQDDLPIGESGAMSCDGTDVMLSCLCVSLRVLYVLYVSMWVL